MKKKGRAIKDALISKIRDAIVEYPYLYVFEIENMKNSVMKQVREEFQGSKSVMITPLSHTLTHIYNTIIHTLQRHARPKPTNLADSVFASFSSTSCVQRLPRHRHWHAFIPLPPSFDHFMHAQLQLSIFALDLIVVAETELQSLFVCCGFFFLSDSFLARIK